MKRSKTVILISAVVLAVYLFSSFDMCWFPVAGRGLDKGFVFGAGWSEHLHSSEEFSIFYQISALYDGRIWLSQGAPPANTVDVTRVGDHYFMLAEPVTAFLLLPFYALGKILLGGNYLIRSAIFGMIIYSILNALLVRKISLQLNLSKNVAVVAAVIFSLATLAVSYSRILYPQPVVTLLMLATIYFLFRYKETQSTVNLVGSFLFYGLTVASFNAFIITAPLFLYFFLRIGHLIDRNVLVKGALALIPSILVFVLWNFAVTGNPLMTPRQVDYKSLNFQVLYTTGNGTWLNVGGIVGTLVSPVGIFFVSPILLVSVLSFSSFMSKARRETLLLASIIIEFWLFVSFVNLGGATGMDWWIGGWANIARYMYMPTALLSIFAAQAVGMIVSKRNLIEGWLISLALVFSFLANITYGIRHDTMVGLSKDFISSSLLVWPYQLGTFQLVFLALAIILVSALFPIYLVLKHRYGIFNPLGKTPGETAERSG